MLQQIHYSEDGCWQCWTCKYCQEPFPYKLRYEDEYGIERTMNVLLPTCSVEDKHMLWVNKTPCYAYKCMWDK